MEDQFRIRNFVIISHIDHGKSTLADRFLEITGTVPKEKMRPQYLDMMALEQERGVTIKMQPVRMEYKNYVLNLIDTPGHADFGYEVSRSLAAVEGAILLVDATKGIQSQTLANLQLAREQKLVIIPVVNKIDLPEARIEETKTSLSQILELPKEDILSISGKTGKNVEQLLERVTEKIPFPKGKRESPLRALIFDSKYDPYKGVIAYVRIFDGSIKKEEEIYLIAGQAGAKVKELGYFKPQMVPCDELTAGEIGYIATGIKEPEKVRVGDTIIKLRSKGGGLRTEDVEPLPGYREPKPMVFASIYPRDPDDYNLLRDALSKLKLNDASLSFEPETKTFLGRGYLCGFLGTFHAEIVYERLKREFSLDVIISSPSVGYKVLKKDGKEVFVKSPSFWPNPSEIKEAKQPWAELKIVTPVRYLGRCLEVLKPLQGKYIETKYISQTEASILYEVPLKEVMTGLYDKLKSQSQGFASMNYTFKGWKKGDLVKLDILINGKKEEAFSRIVSRERAYQEGKRIVKRLKEVFPKQLFSVALQAALGGKIIARETVKARRRDVIAPLYGGDYSRKKKLLEKQKKGKKKLKARGSINLPSQVFLDLLK